MRKTKGHKALKIIGVILLVIIALIVAMFIKASLTPAVPANYEESVLTGGEIEAKYLQNGSYSVSYIEVEADERLGKYEIYYPDDISSVERKYPAIVVSNGTGIKASKYKAVFEHFASWGFVVIGNEEENSWDGSSAEKSLNYLLECNADKDSFFYQKIDTDNIGSLGHSQGGVGAISAVTNTAHSDMYKTVVAESPTNPELADNLQWHYDITKVQIPFLMVAGTGKFDADTVIPLEKMNEMYDALDSVPIKAMVRRTDTEHGYMLYFADGYVTAWFMWQLQGDEYAAKAFVGDRPELLENELYQDQRIDIEVCQTFFYSQGTDTPVTSK